MARVERVIPPLEYVAERLRQVLEEQGVVVSKERLINVLQQLPDRKVEYLISWFYLKDLINEMKQSELSGEKFISEGRFEEAARQFEHAYTLRDRIFECISRLNELEREFKINYNEVMKEIYEILKVKPREVKPEEKPVRPTVKPIGLIAKVQAKIFEVVADLMHKFLDFVRDICDRFRVVRGRTVFKILTSRDREYIRTLLSRKTRLREKPFNIRLDIFQFYEQYWVVEYIYDNFVGGARLQDLITRLMSGEPIDSIVRVVLRDVTKEIVRKLFEELPKEPDVWKSFVEYVSSTWFRIFGGYGDVIKEVLEEIRRRIEEYEERRVVRRATPIERAIERVTQFFPMLYTAPEPLARIIQERPSVRRWSSVFGYPRLLRTGEVTPDTLGALKNIIDRLNSYMKIKVGVTLPEPPWTRSVDALCKYLDDILTKYGNLIREVDEDAYWYLIGWLESLKQMKG